MPPRHPDPVHIGSYTVRAIREPPDNEGCYRWRIEWYVARKCRTCALGRVATADVEGVAIQRIARGDLDAPVVRAGKLDTLGLLLRAYAAHVKGRVELAERSRKVYRNAVRHMLAHLDTTRIPVETSALDGYKRARLLEGASTRLLDLEFKVLRAAWRWGREAGHVDPIDLPRVKMPKHVAVRSRRTPTEGELRRVLAVLARPGARANAAAWPWIGAVLLWATGCRVGELAAATWGALDVEAGTIALDGKTGPREVPLEPPVLAALTRWRASIEARGVTLRPADRVLGVSYETCRQQLAGRHIRRACLETGVPYFTAQAVRRLVVDALFDSGADPGAESAFAGHSERVAQTHYRGVRLKRLREIAARAGLGHFEGGVVVEFKR